MRVSRLMPTVTLVGLITLALLVPLPPWGRAAEAISDLLHAPLFALLAVLIQRFAAGRLRRSSRAVGLLVWMVVAAFGVSTEALQWAVGRHPSGADVAANLLGATAGILWTLFAGSNRQVRAIVGATALVLFALASWGPLAILWDVGRQRAEMPRLASFEHELELTRWTATECRLSRVRDRATHGAWSLRLDLTAGVYPGAGLRWPVPDWTAYRWLQFDVYLEETVVADDPTLLLIVKIEDAHHNRNHDDRFHRAVCLAPGWNRVAIDLSDVAQLPNGRTFDLSRVAFLQFFTVRPSRPRTMYLDNVQLKPVGSPERGGSVSLPLFCHRPWSRMTDAPEAASDRSVGAVDRTWHRRD